MRVTTFKKFWLINATESNLPSSSPDPNDMFSSLPFLLDIESYLVNELAAEHIS